MATNFKFAAFLWEKSRKTQEEENEKTKEEMKWLNLKESQLD